MTAWWQDLSARERVLILIAGGLGVAVVLSLLVIRPIADWQSDAARKAQTARDGYELTLAAAAVAGDRGDDQYNPMALRQAVIATAKNWNVDLTRIGSETPEGQVEVQVAPLAGDALFAWIAQLENQYGISVAFADIANGSDGMVNAQIIVFERMS
ncbi:type II secretion system protein GspM [Hyphococcus sp. DH-69]|uniref:type II secretion system protein GspM n=1 Tax=Hyphococcus formosus TaxID=3143534 RepID=UPI00398BA6B9